MKKIVFYVNNLKKEIITSDEKLEKNILIAKNESDADVAVEECNEVEESIDQTNIVLDLLADHEYRVCMLELGGDI